MKHSPAPWKYYENEDGDLIVQMDESHSVVFGNLEGSCGTCHANALLTSLAPEILETLKTLVIVGWVACDSDIELSETKRNDAMNDLWSKLRSAEIIIKKTELK